MIEKLLGLSLSPSVLARLAGRDGAETDVFYREKPAPKPSSEAEVLVAQADGKGVPMGPSREEQPERSPVRLGKGQKRTKKKEAVVASLYTTGKRVRSAEEVLDSFFSPPDARSSPGETSQEFLPKAGEASTGEASNGPQNKKVWATLEGKDVAFDRLSTRLVRTGWRSCSAA